MDNLIRRPDLDHISNSSFTKWMVFFIALGALAKVDIDAGRMILDEDSIYPFLILALMPLSSMLKIGWQWLLNSAYATRWLYFDGICKSKILKIPSEIPSIGVDCSRIDWSNLEGV